MERLQTSPEGRRAANIIALVLAGYTLVAAAVAAMVILRYRQMYPIDIRWLLYFSVSLTGLIQLWMACFFYLPAHTVLEFSATGLRLTRPRPFRAWSGSWRAVKQVYFHGGLFVIRPTERQWPGWAIKVVPKDATIVEDVKRHLAPGVWLDGYRAGLGFIGALFLPILILVVICLIAGHLVGLVERVLS